MSLSAEQAAFLLDVCKLVPYATELGFRVVGRELGRTEEQQAWYVSRGKSATLASNHLRNCAIDLYFILDNKICYDREKLAPVVAYWKSLSPKNKWGGDWKKPVDMPHFERVP
jgi:hypothetical protein